MMRPRDRGQIEEWHEHSPGRWRRKDAGGDWMPSSGEIVPSEGTTFADAFTAHTAAPPVLIDYGVFRSRWLEPELEALFEARKAHWQVDDFASLAAAQGHVNLSGSTAAAAKALFVSLGVLSAERADAIFSPPEAS